MLLYIFNFKLKAKSIYQKNVLKIYEQFQIQSKKIHTNTFLM